MSNDALPLVHDALVSFHGCGCMSQAMVIRDGRDDAGQAALRKDAGRHKLSVRLIRAGEVMPAWECEEHRAERLARVAKKAKNTTPSLFPERTP